MDYSGIIEGLLTLTNLLLVIGIIVHITKWKTITDTRLENLEKHTQDKRIHYDYEDHSIKFVPRAELNNRLENIESLLEKIEKKIDK